MSGFAQKLYEDARAAEQRDRAEADRTLRMRDAADRIERSEAGRRFLDRVRTAGRA